MSPHAADSVPEVTQAASPDLLALTREDAAAMLATYRTENRRPRQWLGVVTGIGGLLRATVGGHIAIIASIYVYKLVVKGEPSEMLPVKVLDRDV